MTIKYYRAGRLADPAIVAMRLMQPGDAIHSNRGWHAIQLPAGTGPDKPQRIGPCVTITRANGDVLHVISPRLADKFSANK